MKLRHVAEIDRGADVSGEPGACCPAGRTEIASGRTDSDPRVRGTAPGGTRHHSNSSDPSILTCATGAPLATTVASNRLVRPRNRATRTSPGAS